MRNLILIVLFAVLASSGCAEIPGLGPSLLDRSKGRPECEWGEWHDYGEKALGREEASSVSFSLETGTKMVVVNLTHMVSTRVAEMLMRECLAGGPGGAVPVRTEYKTGKSRWHPLRDVLFPVDINLGEYSRWEVLEKAGEDGRWAVYRGRAVFIVCAGRKRISDKPPPGPSTTLTLHVNGDEAGRLYLHD